MCVICGVKIIKSLKTTVPLLLIIAWVISCSPKFTATPAPTTVTGSPDYESLDLWAAHPRKTDPSDRIPEPLQEQFEKDSSVDVFFIHPTSYTSKELVKWNADLADSALNRKTDNSSIQFQASAFNRYNVYAPRYRQAHIQSYYTTDTISARKAIDLAYSDVKAAFEY
jgi:Protein of unknown function (DUF3089)